MMNFKKYNNVTKIVVPGGVRLSNTSFSNAFNNMRALQSFNLPNNVTNLSKSFYQCVNLSCNTWCGDNVVNFFQAYYACRNLTGSPVCGNNVVHMGYAYEGCCNLTGSPVFGENVINAYFAYSGCSNLTGNPIFPSKYNPFSPTTSEKSISCIFKCSFSISNSS